MRFKEIKKLFETTQLDEVSMSPTNLQKFVNSPEAAGMLVGFEFEMVVPNVDGRDGDDSNYEADYSYNESAGSIDEIIDFFRHGDFSSMGRVEAADFQSRLVDEYMQWSNDAAENYINDHDDNLMSDIRSRLDDEVDRDDAAEEAHTRWVEENPKGDTASEEASKEIRNLTLQMIEDRLDAMMEDTDSSEYQSAYDDARLEMEDDFRDSGDGDQDAWLRDIGVNDMEDARDEWGFDWPHMVDTNYGNGGDSIETIADEFAEAMGLDKVNSSSSYHNARRDGTHWCVEPDSSITPDDNASYGLEFISPPLPLKDSLEQMTKIITWAKDKGCTTNSSTGLHMNISVPDYKAENLDFVKLALFIGDEHILQKFGRTYNNYCSSALKIVKEKIDSVGIAGPLLQAMRDHLNVAASKAVHSGSTQKFTSINTKTGYVEFRGPGGDYLDQDIDELINTALRLAQSLRIATDETAHKQEYAKKLYKLVVPTDKDTDNDNSVIMFSRYAMGQINKDDLLTSLRQNQATRKAKKFPNGPKREWTVVRKSNPGYKVSFSATSAAEALQLAKSQISGWTGVDDENFKVTAMGDDAEYNKAKEEHFLSTMEPMWKAFIRDIATITTDRLKQRKAEFEAGVTTAAGDVALSILPEWKKIVLARINNELATRKNNDAAIGALDDIEELPETHREFARDIRNKTDAGLNSIKVGIDAGDFRYALTNIQSSIFLNVVVNEIARRAGLTADMADLDGFVNTLGQTSTWQLYDPATDEVFATYSRLTQGQAIDRRATLRHLRGNENIEMRNLGSAEQSTTQARGATPSIAIDDELRSRRLQTYTIYDGTGRVVNTIRATSAALALEAFRLFAHNNNIDTTNYTARPTVQQAADHVLPTPGFGQSTYDIEHIPSGAFIRQLGNDAADAIQRLARLTGSTPNNFRIASPVYVPQSTATDFEVVKADGSIVSRIRGGNIVYAHRKARELEQDLGLEGGTLTVRALPTATNLQEYRVGNHTFGREIIRAPSRAEAIRLFAHNNNISVDRVQEEPGFVAELVDDSQSQDAAAQLTTQVAESLGRMRKLAGLK